MKIQQVFQDASKVLQKAIEQNQHLHDGQVSQVLATLASSLNQAQQEMLGTPAYTAYTGKTPADSLASALQFVAYAVERSGDHTAVFKNTCQHGHIQTVFVVTSDHGNIEKLLEMFPGNIETGQACNRLQ